MLERYCERAAACGIDEIAITEHSHRFGRIQHEVMPHWERPPLGPMCEATNHVLEVEGGADLDAYVAVLQSAQEQGLPLLIGLEVDYLPGTTDAMASVLADYPFDVLLGSVHWLDDWLFDAYDNEVFGQAWHQRNIDEVFTQYIDAVLEVAGSGLVDVLAHIDVITVAGYRPDDLAAHYQRLVEGLAGCNVAIEYSSAGLRKPAATAYPSDDLFDLLAGTGMAFTTASDAHTADQIGYEFDQLRAGLTRRDVSHLAAFRRRQRTMVPVET